MTAPSTSAQRPSAVALHDVSKRFHGVPALERVSFAARAGSVLALVGENGAGKSTAGRIVSGLQRPDAGTVLLDGEPVRFASPREALRRGIATIAQELALAPSRSVIDNVLLGAEPAVAGLVSGRAQRRRYRELDEQVGFGIDPQATVGALRIADQQKVELLRALARGARVIVLDEPTARLGSEDARSLSRLVRRLADAGTTVIYVSHFLQEVLALADDVVVLKDGRVVRAVPAAGETPDSLVTAMLGRELEQAFPQVPAVPAGARELLRVRGLRVGDEVAGVDLDVRAGEIVGVTGLVGSGRSETAKAIFGALPIAAGTVALDGREVRFRRTADAMRAGVALLPESRADEGLLMGRSVGENVALCELRRLARGGLISPRAERAMVRRSLRRFGVKGAAGAEVASLSGGNQQKVLLAKWLAGRPRLLIADEPTRGIDVAAKRAIYDLIVDAVRDGLGVLLISSEVEEVIGLAHRVLVFRGGRVVAELAGDAIHEDPITRAALAA